MTVYGIPNKKARPEIAADLLPHPHPPTHHPPFLKTHRERGPSVSVVSAGPQSLTLGFQAHTKCYIRPGSHCLCWMNTFWPEQIQLGCFMMVREKKKKKRHAARYT